MTITRSRPLAGILALFCVSALAAVLIAPAVDAAPVANAAKTARAKSCDISRVADKLGATSTTSLKVVGIRCGSGISVIRAFHACRLKNGTSGRCVRLVKGYACGELRTNSPTQFNGTVTCRKDRKSVVSRYSQTL